ncbi:activator of s-phase kinase-related [Anaeramoeba flamelloides]|uniref:Activator of s-phase kinase-related n=1 Tax=Anaeramoeba flamelloides TaxID=1746091 RepID=A0ABQ8YD30_9EUKA|nr:activator of s-phase kinase-related [Anaeramoeba flamelloides]
MTKSLTGKNFFLDISHPSTEQKIQNQLELMGAKIKTVLNCSVNYLITDQSRSIISSTCKLDSQNSKKKINKPSLSLPVLGSQKKCNISKAKTLGSRIVSVRCIQKWLDKHNPQKVGGQQKENNKIKPKQAKKKQTREKIRSTNQLKRSAFDPRENKIPRLSQTKLILTSRNPNLKTVKKKKNILQNANNIRAIRKIKKIPTNVNNNQTNLGPQKKKLSIVNKNYNFLQIEDKQSDYQPFKKEFAKNKMRTTLFFLQQRSSRRLYNLDQVIGERGQEWKSRQKRRLKKKRRMRIKGSGYCENCRVKYSNIEKHCQSKRHQRFCKSSKNFGEVDSFIEKIENIFLQQNKEKQLEKPNLQKTEDPVKREKAKDFLSSSLSLECEETPHSTNNNNNFNTTTTTTHTTTQTTAATTTATTSAFLTLTDRVDEWYSPNFPNQIYPLVDQIEITKKKIEPIIIFDDSLNWNDQEIFEDSDDDFVNTFKSKKNKKRKKRRRKNKN